LYFPLVPPKNLIGNRLATPPPNSRKGRSSRPNRNHSDGAPHLPQLADVGVGHQSNYPTLAKSWRTWGTKLPLLPIAIISFRRRLRTRRR
jgi:hypothetical protein